MSFYLQNYIHHAREYLSLSIPQFISCSGISISSYIRSIFTSSNICIFLFPRLFLYPVKFISFYHCKRNLDHIVNKKKKNKHFKFVANAHNTENSACTETRTLTAHLYRYIANEIHVAIHVYSSTIPNQLVLSLCQSKINPIFEYPFLYFALYLVYLRYHFLSSFYSINKSNYWQLIIQYVQD